MKVSTILLIFVSFWAFCSANEDLEFVGRILHGTHQQVGYGINLKPESQYPTIEYSPAVSNLLRKGVKSLLLDRSDALTASYSFSNVSQTCRNDTTTMFQDLLNRKPYAVSMFDSDGKPGSGIEHGNFIWLGNVQQCQQAQAEKFKGHMCNIVTNLGIPQIGVYNIFGICFPDSCSSKEVQELVWRALQVIHTKIKVLIYPRIVDCPAPLPYSTGDYFAIVICSIILFAAFTGTLADVVFMYLEEKDTDQINVRMENTVNYASIGSTSVNEATERLGLLSNVPTNEVIHSEIQIGCFGTVKQILLAFSVISNTRKLLNTSTASGSLTAINGMRVLSMFWVILGHTYLFNISIFDNILDALPIVKRFTFQCILNATYAVDTFFFMSGLLVSYTVLKKLRNQRKINWPMFYIHRFWRLTPVYAFFILIWTTLSKHMVWEGPLAITQKTGKLNQFDLCEKYWWTNLLYINNFWPNYGNIGEQCLGWGWYLANDMQFYIMSPLFIILLNKTKALGTGGVLFGIFGCVVSRIITADYYGFRLPPPLTPVNHTHESWAHSSPLYNKPYTRVAPFLVGIWLGYILVIDGNRARLAKKKLLIGWCIAITIGISVIYGLYGYFKDYPALHQGGKAASLLYFGLSRLAWSIALAWVIFVCAVGHGGPVNAFLSLKAWAPLGRLTYCAYIVHPAVIYYFTFTYEKPLHYMEFTLIRLFLSILVISYGIAFILSILVEVPMLALEKILFRRWIR